MRTIDGGIGFIIGGAAINIMNHIRILRNEKKNIYRLDNFPIRPFPQILDPLKFVTIIKIQNSVNFRVADYEMLVQIQKF